MAGEAMGDDGRSVSELLRVGIVEIATSGKSSKQRVGFLVLCNGTEGSRREAGGEEGGVVLRGKWMAR